jgi:hypothetical protein
MSLPVLGSAAGRSGSSRNPQSFRTSGGSPGVLPATVLALPSALRGVLIWPSQDFRLCCTLVPSTLRLSRFLFVGPRFCLQLPPHAPRGAAVAFGYPSSWPLWLGTLLRAVSLRPVHHPLVAGLARRTTSQICLDAKRSRQHLLDTPLSPEFCMLRLDTAESIERRLLALDRDRR